MQQSDGNLIGDLLKILVMLVFLWMVLLLTAVLSVAGFLAKEELESESTLSKSQIKQMKCWKAIGLLPFALVFFIALGDSNFEDENRWIPKTEEDYREVYRDSESDLDNKKFKVQIFTETKTEIEDRLKNLNTDLSQAVSSVDKSEIEAEIRELNKEYSKVKRDLINTKNDLPKLEKQLSDTKNQFDLFKAGKPTSFNSQTFQRKQSTLKIQNRALYALYCVLYLVFSILISGRIKSFIENPNPKIKLAFSIINLLDIIYSTLASLGLAPWKMMGLYQPPLETITETKFIKLGRERHAFLTEDNLNYHTQIIGGSGAGKTNLIKILIEDRIAKGHSVLFFDLKADVELMDWLTGACSAYERRDDLIVVNMSDPTQSHAYNPIINGSETEISSQLMNSFTWSEPFYKNISEGALLISLKAFCFLRDNCNLGFHLGDLYSFFTNSEFRMDFLSNVAGANYPVSYWNDLKRINEELSTSRIDNYQSLIIQLTKIMNSTAREIVTDKFYEEESFDFRDAMLTGKVSYLFMNSLKLKETASVMGKMMLQDLMKTVGNIYDDRGAIKRPTTLIIDEFASFAMPDFGEFIEKARGAGIGIVVAYQSRKSLDHIGQSLSIKVNENTATKIVFHTQDSDDVEWFSSLIGTKKDIAETYQSEEGMFWDNKTGQKSVREVEQFIIHPNEIKNLSRGQALLYCSKVDQHYGVINIAKANEYAEVYEKRTKTKEIAVERADCRDQLIQNHLLLNLEKLKREEYVVTRKPLRLDSGLENNFIDLI